MTAPRTLALLVLALLAAAVSGRLGGEAAPTPWSSTPATILVAAAAALCGVAALAHVRLRAFALLAAAVSTGAAAVLLLQLPGVEGEAGLGFWCLCAAGFAATCGALAGLSALPLRTPAARTARDIAVPAVFGLALVTLAEVILRGAGVPSVLLPAPSSVATRFLRSLPMLREDLVQTFVRGVLIGYIIGNSAGFLTAVLVQRSAFLKRGLLPFGNFVSSLPIVGIAPVMVMWFGFDWPSKAAVVAIVTYFPMLTNAVAGLSTAGRMETDLMHSYAASFPQQFTKLRLPASLPFVFNALKINSTLALIGAIVAEFFGTPVRGMGFRISIEAARMSMDMVWAEILLAALVGAAFYGCLAAIERTLTFWHPSNRV